jgi:hypothetical protein
MEKTRQNGRLDRGWSGTCWMSDRKSVIFIHDVLIIVTRTVTMLFWLLAQVFVRPQTLHACRSLHSISVHILVESIMSFGCSKCSHQAGVDSGVTAVVLCKCIMLVKDALLPSRGRQDITSKFYKGDKGLLCFSCGRQAGKRMGSQLLFFHPHSFIKSTIPTPPKSASEGLQCSFEFIREVGEAPR